MFGVHKIQYQEPVQRYHWLLQDFLIFIKNRFFNFVFRFFFVGILWQDCCGLLLVIGLLSLSPVVDTTIRPRTTLWGTAVPLILLAQDPLALALDLWDSMGVERDSTHGRRFALQDCLP